jgi:hypothetical protein
MTIPGNLLPTAMAVMPEMIEVSRAVIVRIVNDAIDRSIHL